MIRCKLGFHNYSAWGETYAAYAGTRQARRCLDCNKVSIRKVKAALICGDYSIQTGDPLVINKTLRNDDEIQNNQHDGRRVQAGQASTD